MTLTRRVATVESTLSPTQLVLRWLEEAHAFGALESYVRALLEAAPENLPIDRLAGEAVKGVETRSKGKRPEVVRAAVRSALRETIFRFELVMRINVTAHDLLERAALLDALLAAHVSLLTYEKSPKRRAEATYLAWFAQLRDAAVTRVSELRAAQEARRLVEWRYLDGHPALFPVACRAWEEQLKRTAAVADMACRLAELNGVPPAEPGDPDSAVVRMPELVADLVEPAKSTALEKLGEGERAFGIAMAWLRSKMRPAETRPDAQRAGPQAATP